MPIDQARITQAIKDFDRERHRSYYAVEIDADLLAQFQARWPMQELEESLNIKSYSIGAGDKDNFCYWIERRTKKLGSILGSAAKKFKVYYSKKNKKYECVHEFSEPQEAFIQTKKSILELLEAAGRGDHEAVKAVSLFKNSNLVRGKILFLYYPDKYINIFSEEDIDFFLETFGVDFTDNEHVIDKQQKLIRFKTGHPEMKQWSNMKFGKFLYSNWAKPPSQTVRKSFKEKRQVTDREVIVDYSILEKYFYVFKKHVESVDGIPFRSFTRSKYLKKEEGHKDTIFTQSQVMLGAAFWKTSRVGSGDIVQAVICSIEQPNNYLLFHNISKGEAKREDRLLYEVQKDSKRMTMLEGVLFRFYRDEEESDEETFNELKALGATYPLIAFLFFMKNKNKYLSLAPLNFDKVFKKLQIQFSTYKQCGWKNYGQYLSIVSEVKIYLEEKMDEHVSLLDAHSFLWLLRKLHTETATDSHGNEEISIEELELEKFPAQDQGPDEFNSNEEPGDSPHDAGRAARNKLTGDTAENHVVETEKIRLIKAGRIDLAKSVERVSATRDCGYDVLSFELNGKEKRIEVKGTTSPTLKVSFGITRNEIRQSKLIGGYNFYLYIVYNVNGSGRNMKIRFMKNPDFFDGALFRMKATQYQIRYQPKKGAPG